MPSEIRKIWIVWLLVMAVLSAMTWALLQIELPGGSSGTPTLEEFLGYFGHIGVFGTIRVLAFIFLPPVVLTWLEIIKARRRHGP
jgi:hypothetical protein